MGAKQGKAKQVPPAEVPPTQVPPAEVPPTQVTPTEVSPTQVPPAEVPPTQVPPAEVPPTQVPPAEVSPTQVPPAEVPPTQVPPAEVPPTQVLPAEVPPTQVPPSEVPPAEVPPTEIPVVIRLSERRKERERKEEAHRKEIDQLEQARKDLEKEVFGIKTPVFKWLGVRRFKKLRQDVANLEENIDKHNDECYDIANLRQAVAIIKNRIDILVEDNKIYFSWALATGVLSAVSFGVAFIPVVGLIVSPILVLSPYLGRLAHRLIVSHKRKKRFTQTQQ